MPNQRSCHWWREWSCKGGYCGWMSRLSLCRCCGCHWPREVRHPGRRRWSGSSLSCLKGSSSRKRARTRAVENRAVPSLILYISKAGRYLWGGVWYFWGGYGKWGEDWDLDSGSWREFESSTSHQTKISLPSNIVSHYTIVTILYLSALLFASPINDLTSLLV